MKLPRRDFLATAVSATTGIGALSLGKAASAATATLKTAKTDVSTEALNQPANRPVLKLDVFKDPIIIDSVELLQKGKDHFVRVRSKDGAEGISVDNGRMDVLAPIFQKLIAPTS